jgi:hypothetical protein
MVYKSRIFAFYLTKRFRSHVFTIIIALFYRYCTAFHHEVCISIYLRFPLLHLIAFHFHVQVQ